MCIKSIEALHKLTTLILMLGIKKIISSYISINMGNSISCVSTTVFLYLSIFVTFTLKFTIHTTTLFSSSLNVQCWFVELKSFRSMLWFNY